VIIIVPASSSSATGPSNCGACIDCSGDPATNSAGPLSDTYTATGIFTTALYPGGLAFSIPINYSIGCTWSGAATVSGHPINVVVTLTNPGDTVNPCSFLMRVTSPQLGDLGCGAYQFSSPLSCLFDPTTPVGSYDTDQSCDAGGFNLSGAAVG
jgi:hypothetical protein